ncbi:rhomboid protease ROM4, putative [Plasmodium chabaudi chabaudi]|uniref:Rhomboid-like protease n=1 Tax=Plasmodium chabaudi chabaudi TaxID=31271 RepID=A0A1D3RXA4_PLACU|nr:rhomboid protease ROM4, putative [Plasmodium chabaudi chabaudi]
METNKPKKALNNSKKNESARESVDDATKRGAKSPPWINKANQIKKGNLGGDSKNNKDNLKKEIPENTTIPEKGVGTTPKNAPISTDNSRKNDIKNDGKSGAKNDGKSGAKNDSKHENANNSGDVKELKMDKDRLDEIRILVNNESELHTLPSGAVGRRAPLNPFSSPMLGKYRRKNANAKKKVKDPRLNNNPLVGRLVVCISTTAILFWVFFSELIYNYNTFNGRCISKVLYPIYTESVISNREPFFVFLGYGACEYNLEESAFDRHFIGTQTSDNGWPKNKVEDNPDAHGYATWDSINNRVYNQLGGLNTNYIRNYGEIYRLFWSMYLHGGLMHIIFNVICQIQILWMIEPDWGFIRTLFLFFISGITGNLLSAVCDPCGVTIGSSGSLYGLIGALFAYYVEYWKTIPRPCCVIVFMMLVVIFGIFIGMFGYTDNYAHIGGCLGGILYGFATITTVSSADKCTLGERMLTSPPFSWFLSNEAKQLIEEKAREKKIKGENYRKKQIANKVHKTDALHTIMSVMKNRINEEGRPSCKMKPREWIVRITAASILIILWIVLFIYLLDESAYRSYTPMGQIKFSGVHSCFCCDVVKKIPLTQMEKLYWCFSSQDAFDYYCKE